MAQPRGELGLTDLTLGALVRRAHQPADEERRPALGGQRTPQPPQVRSLVLLVGGLGEHAGVDEAGVQPLIEAVDQRIGSQSVVTGDPDDHREVGITEVVLSVDQPHPKVRDCGLVVLFADLVTDFAHLKHARHGIADPALAGRNQSIG